MARPLTNPDSIAQGLYDAMPHLDPGRDGYAVRRLAELYRLLVNVHRRLGEMVNAPFTGSGSKAGIMDEYHKLYADTLRLEQELAVTYAARSRVGIKPDTSSDDLGGAKG